MANQQNFEPGQPKRAPYRLQLPATPFVRGSERYLEGHSPSRAAEAFRTSEFCALLVPADLHFLPGD